MSKHWGSEIHTNYDDVVEAVQAELVAIYETDGGIDPDDFNYIGSEVAGRLIGMAAKRLSESI